jgi:hypothetical protein
MHLGQIPKTVFTVFVGGEAFHGAKAKNPFNFEHCKLTQFAADVDGTNSRLRPTVYRRQILQCCVLGQSYPTRPYQTNFTEGKSLDAYNGFQDVVGKRFSPSTAVLFDRSEFAKGYTIMGVNLAPSGDGRGSLGLIKEGNLSLALAFETGLTASVMCISLLFFDTVLEINHFRQLISDFSG